MLPLPRNLHFEVYNMWRLPRNLRPLMTYQSFAPGIFTYYYFFPFPYSLTRNLLRNAFAGLRDVYRRFRFHRSVCEPTGADFVAGSGLQ